MRYLQVHWQENLGIEIMAEILEWGKFVDKRAAQPAQIHLGAWVADYPDPHNFLNEGLSGNSLTWRSQAYDGLVERARRIRDQGERMRLYGQADRILVEEAPIMPLLHGCWPILVKPWVSRYPVSAMGSWFWKDVVIEAH